VDIKEIGGVSFGRMGGEPGAAPGVHDSGQTRAPSLSSNSRGMGGSTGSTVTVNVQGADPNAVVQALQRYVRTSGPVPVNIRAM
jgi:hypothetical protein